MTREPDGNEGRMRAWFQTAWNERSETALRDALAPGFRAHGIVDEPLGTEGFVEAWRGLLVAFGDLRLTVEGGVAEDDVTAYRLHTVGRHAAPGLGIAPTGREVSFPFFAFLRWTEGRIAEVWLGLDMAAVYRQLGARIV